MKYDPWGKRPEIEGTLAKRASGELGEMQCTMQLVKLIQSVYKPGMSILDVGCNVGHYLHGIRRIDAQAQYRGVDAYEHYIDQARNFFANDQNASFAVADITKPLYKENPYDIVYCCNVILHLPFFKTPVRNLIESTKKYCFIRTLLGGVTTKVQRAFEEKFDDEGQPLDFYYENTYSTEYFTDFIRSLGCDVEVIDDEFDSKVLASEYQNLKRGNGTRIIDGIQADQNIILNWKFVKITKK